MKPLKNIPIYVINDVAKFDFIIARRRQESYTQNRIEKVRTILRVAYNWLMFPVRFRTKQP